MHFLFYFYIVEPTYMALLYTFFVDLQDIFCKFHSDNRCIMENGKNK